MTVQEVADYLRVSERTVYDWASKGQIPCGKFGATWRFKRDQIEQWINGKLNKEDESQPLTISNILSPKRISFLSAVTKQQAIEQIIELISTSDAIENVAELRDAVLEREKLMSTAIGLGIAVPHVRLSSVKRLVMALGISRAGINDYDSLDGQPVKAIFLIAAAKDQHVRHIKTLALIGGFAKDDIARRSLFSAQSESEVYKLLTGKNYE